MQRIAVAVQRGNAAAVLGSISSGDNNNNNNNNNNNTHIAAIAPLPLTTHPR